jgi:hypothetical protein
VDSRRKKTKKCYLRKVQVCKGFFLIILDISKMSVRNAAAKKIYIIFYSLITEGDIHLASSGQKISENT